MDECGSNLIGIAGSGRALPCEVIRNAAFAKAGISNEWIIARTGVRECRRAGAAESASSLGATAAMQALEDARFSPGLVDLILCTTISPDVPMPATACLFKRNSGLGARLVLICPRHVPVLSSFCYPVLNGNRWITARTGQ